MKKIFSSETARPKACTFSMQISSMVLYIDPANDAPWVQNGDISSHIVTMGKLYKNHLRKHESQNFYILCVAMCNTPLYKSCHL